MDLLQLHGAWLIDKPEGISSFGVIEAIQRALRTRTGLKKSALPSLGHGGTLDPFATGLLVVCVGRAVKLTRWFLDSEKTYSGRIRFGETTIPGDPTDPVSESGLELPADIADTRLAAATFVGRDYEQTPPMHSAKKQGGKALYELARKGIEVERKAKTCQVSHFEIDQFQGPHPSPQSGAPVTTCEFLTRVTAGTYIRVLAQDLGVALGTRAMLETLRREGSGPKQLRDALPLAELLARLETGGSPANITSAPFWIPFDRVMEGLFPEVELGPDEIRDLHHGKKAGIPVWVARANTSPASGTLILRDQASRLHAVLERNEVGHWDIARVFPQA